MKKLVVVLGSLQQINPEETQKSRNLKKKKKKKTILRNSQDDGQSLLSWYGEGSVELKGTGEGKQLRESQRGWVVGG